MTAYRARCLLFAFLLVFSGVAANAMLLQGDSRRWTELALLSPDMNSKPDTTASAPEPRPVRRVLPRWNPALSISDDGISGDVDAGVSVKAAQAQPALSIDISPKSRAGRETVRAIQRELAARGYEPGPVDGILGIMTRGAIMAFEHDERLALTASPSSALLERIILGGVGQAPTGKRGQSSKQAKLIARSVQDTLTRLGYVPGPADGIVSTNTARAIKAFERDHNMAPSGRISGRLISEIGRVSGARFSIAAGW